MAETKVIMPQMGESIFEGTITKWLKKKGDRIERDEPLFEISTDKIDSEIPSPASGVVQEILVKEGATVQINTVVAVIGDGSAKPAEAKEPPKEEPKAKEEPKKEAPKESQKQEPKEVKGPAPVAGPTKEVEEEADEEETVEQHHPGASLHPSSAKEGSDSSARSSPLVRRIAKENNVDLSALAGKGTGLNGRITKDDILKYASAPPKSGGVARSAGVVYYGTTRHRRLRRAVAALLT